MSQPEHRKALLWKELQAALGHISRAEFEMNRGDHAAAVMWLGDARRALGAAALLLSDDVDAAAYSRLLTAVLTPATTTGQPHVPLD